MKNYILVFIFVFVSSSIFSQTKIWNNWYFGDKAGLCFNTEPPTVLTDGQLSAIEGCATISDNDGNLLFYTNGVTVWDRNHNIMPNGTDLMGHMSAAQSSLILPKPNSNNIYYIFTNNAYEDKERCLRYSVVDMNLNNGTGDIIPNQKNILIHNQSSESLSAIIHSNGNDYWIISHSNNSNRFYCNLFSETGVDTTSVISDISADYYHLEIMKIKVAPFFNKIATTDEMGIIALFNINNTTGNINIDKLYNFYAYLMYGHTFGIEFSQDNTKLYVSRAASKNTILYQFDLSENNFEPHEVTTIKPYYGFFDMQIASNEKIYISGSNKQVNFLSVIDKPNEKGTDCDFQFNIISVNYSKYNCLPNCVFMPPKATFDVEGTCLGSNSIFTINNTTNIQSVLWDFGDGTTSTEQNPTHEYTTAGIYTVTLTVTYHDSNTQTITKEIEVFGKPPKLIIEHD